MKKISLTLVLLLLADLSDAGKLSCEESDTLIALKQGEKVLLQYNKVPTEEAARHEPFYTRSGYIHPLYSPSGKVVTGDYCEDHKHQHGLFFAWTKTEFEGRETEFWNQKLEKGKVSYHETKAIVDETGETGFDVEQLWEDITAPGGSKPVLIETWKVRAREGGEDFYFLEIESEQRCASDSPLTIKKYHYGGMAFRGPVEWLPVEEKGKPRGKMFTNEGKSREEGNHSRPEWVLMSGPFGDDYAGVAIRCDPSNFRAPQWVRLHPNKPYFVFAPMVEEPFDIVPGKPYVSKYQYVVFDGDWDAAKVEEAFAGWK